MRTPCSAESSLAAPAASHGAGQPSRSDGSFMKKTSTYCDHLTSGKRIRQLDRTVHRRNIERSNVQSCTAVYSIYAVMSKKRAWLVRNHSMNKQCMYGYTLIKGVGCSGQRGAGSKGSYVATTGNTQPTAVTQRRVRTGCTVEGGSNDLT